jgi:RHS repeat-associated protein
MLFDGSYLDITTGLYDLEARQYDPTTGRFLSLDPLDASVQDPYESAYAFVNDQPTVLIDPAGEFGWSSITGAVDKGTRWVKKETHTEGARVLGAFVENLPGVGDAINLVKVSVDIGNDTYNCVLNNSESQACSNSEWTYAKDDAQLVIGIASDFGPRWVQTGWSALNFLWDISSGGPVGAMGLPRGSGSAAAVLGSSK